MKYCFIAIKRLYKQKVPDTIWSAILFLHSQQKQSQKRTMQDQVMEFSVAITDKLSDANCPSPILWNSALLELKL